MNDGIFWVLAGTAAAVGRAHDSHSHSDHVHDPSRATVAGLGW